MFSMLDSSYYTYRMPDGEFARAYDLLKGKLIQNLPQLYVALIIGSVSIITSLHWMKNSSLQRISQLYKWSCKDHATY